jgi:hypothetical protein
MSAGVAPEKAFKSSKAAGERAIPISSHENYIIIAWNMIRGSICPVVPGFF